MAAPNMATITESIERSLRNCSLSNNNTDMVGGSGLSATSESSAKNNSRTNVSANDTLELNSHVRLPYFWEQCLDLKTGEVYYINWRTGMKSRDDPRTSMMNNLGGGAGLVCSEDEGDEADHSLCDSQGSSTGEEEEEDSSPSSSSTTSRTEQSLYKDSILRQQQQQQGVLVVAGCKGCFMYLMVPKQVEDCPKCFGQLLHFDSSYSE